MELRFCVSGDDDGQGMTVSKLVDFHGELG